MIIALEPPSRKRTRLRCGSALLCALMLVGSPVSAGDATSAAAQKAQLARVHKQIEAIAADLAKDRRRADRAQAELEDTERALSAARLKLRALAAEVAARQQALRHIEEQQAAATKRLQDEAGALATQLRSAYLMGSRSKVRLLLSQDAAANAERMLAYYDALNRARLARLQLIQDQLAALDALAAEHRAAQQALDQKQAQQQQALTELEGRNRQRAQQVAALKAGIGDSETELQRLQMQEQQIQKLLEALRKSLQAAPAQPSHQGRSFSQLKGDLVWPLRGSLLAKFGQTKAGGPLTWNGVWIAADAGAPVKAAAAGRVAYVGWMQRFGLLVIVQHDQGYFTLYGHNQATHCEIGQQVVPGQTLAEAGNSGGHDRSGVYFELRKGSTVINPLPWLGP